MVSGFVGLLLVALSKFTIEDATISGYDSHSSLRHVHCPRCGKIITFIDFLTDDTHMMSFSEALRKLKEDVGADSPAIERADELNQEIAALSC